MQRRVFVSVTALAAGGAYTSYGQKLGVWTTLGGLIEEDGTPPLEGARWFAAEKSGDGMAYTFPAGTLARAKCITTDMLLEGKDVASWLITLREGEKGRAFRFAFGGLAQCSFRVRLDLASSIRTAGWPIAKARFSSRCCSGDRVDLSKVDRLTFTVLRKGAEAGPMVHDEPVARPPMVAKLANLVLAEGTAAGRVRTKHASMMAGQDAQPGRMKPASPGSIERPGQTTWPESFSRWGGWKARKLGEGTGFFRTHHDGRPLVAGRPRGLRVLVRGPGLRARGLRARASTASRRH